MASRSLEPDRDERSRRATILESVLRNRRSQLLRQVRWHSERVEDADDALADACVQFLSSYDGPDETDDALHWLLKVSKRCAWEIRRRERKRTRIAPIVPIDRSQADERGGLADPAEMVERIAEADQVLEAMDQLGHDERIALLLLGLGFTYAEIGDLRGWTYTKVNRCISEGRRKVRDLLEGGERS